MISIIDYGVGNLASISNMLKKVGVACKLVNDEDEVFAADRIILPGVGSFDTCVRRLQQSGLMEMLRARVMNDKVPVLGVCVGMQMLFANSEEGVLPGLGWIKGKVVKFDQSRLESGAKVPHMGWSNVVRTKSSRLLEGLNDEARFYFVHSYHPEVMDRDDVLLTADYGYSFVAAVARDNVMGVQFHPEKSHRFGMTLLANFAKF